MEYNWRGNGGGNVVFFSYYNIKNFDIGYQDF